MKKRGWIFVGCSLFLIALFLFIQWNPFLLEQPKIIPPAQTSNILTKLKQVSDEKGKINYLILGDSVALGKGAEIGAGYGLYVQEELERERLHVELDNQGVSGQTSSELREMIRKPELEQKIRNADLINITIGGNDLLKSALDQGNWLQALSEFASIQAQYNENIGAILDHLRSLNDTAPILMTTLYNPISTEEIYYPLTEKLLQKWNTGMRKISSQFPEVTVIEVASLFQKAKKDWLADEIHPNEYGYRLIAKQIVEQIRREI